MTKRTPPMV